MELLESLLKMQQDMKKKYGDALKPKIYIMTWSSWCKVRLDLKAAGIPIEYRQVGRHKWRRFIAGNEVMLSRFAMEDKIFELPTSEWGRIFLTPPRPVVYSVVDAVARPADGGA